MMATEKKEEKVYRQLESNKLLQQIMFQYMLEGYQASEEKRLA